ncbi:hypothetical protein JG687_00011840 [Phytophthora cactorum]|uniref:F-box domain n=1 Tax=Phytophthora cactorum TaxID=29920 RepID=A0A8T1U5W0_9STRA|nr:hypothetical protein JG687_00011840 [Phytophthora cactorum]
MEVLTLFVAHGRTALLNEVQFEIVEFLTAEDLLIARASTGFRMFNYVRQFLHEAVVLVLTKIIGTSRYPVQILRDSNESDCVLKLLPLNKTRRDRKLRIYQVSGCKFDIYLHNLYNFLRKGTCIFMEQPSSLMELCNVDLVGNFPDTERRFCSLKFP